MLKPKFDVQSIRVASPCSVGWETMTGDDRVRQCDSCQLNIYNTAEMTTQEIETLVRKAEGRLCIRLYRRADGTVLTKDCPVGLRALRQRTARFATASLTTILGLFSIAFGQNNDPGKQSVNLAYSEKGLTDRSVLTGEIIDPGGAVISGALVKIHRVTNKKREKEHRTVVSNNQGAFAFADLVPGTYEIEVTFPGFKKSTIQSIEIVEGKKAKLIVVMQFGDASITVGIIGNAPLIDMSSSGITTVVFRRKID